MRHVVHSAAGLVSGTEILAAPDIPGVEVLRVNAPARVWRWYHETYSIMSPVLPIRAEWKYRNVLHRTEPVTIGLMEPGELHADVCKLDKQDAIRALFISPDVMHDMAGELCLPAGDVHFDVAQVHDQDVFDDFIRLHATLESEATALERQTRFSSFVERILDDFGERRPRVPTASGEPAAIRQARELLQERWDENVQLDELVAATGVGRFQLIRAFHAATGVPPHAYLIRIRVARAMTMIRLGMPLVEVALHSGFADQSHLTRHFTRVIGVSPGRYRHAVR